MTRAAPPSPAQTGPAGTALRSRNGSSSNHGRAGTTPVADALEAALRARAPGVHASTPLVRGLARKVGRELGLDAPSLALLDVSTQLRDIGLIGLPDAVVLATAPLGPGDWETLNRHPELGASVLEELPAVAPAAPIVRAHHERWDGGGYPSGQDGESIPLLSRVIATCDAFVAMASDRPHRSGMGAEAALECISRERGAQLDPTVVDALEAALREGERDAPPTPDAAPAVAQRGNPGLTDLASAIADFDPLPAFAPACERVLTIVATDGVSRGEIVSGIESDTGLTIAILRRAGAVASRRPIANVSDAVAALTSEEIAATIETLPRAQFPWRTSPLDLLMHRCRVHAQAVARAADRIARELELNERDDVLVAALLHDIGKLVMDRTLAEHAGASELTSTPEERVRDEQRALGMDHAGLGGHVLTRWGLPAPLAGAVAAHHSADTAGEVATYVRLADMVAHHAQGDAIDRKAMLRLAGVCGLSPAKLRDILFDLPHAGGSRRRRADPSPLTKRETAVLRELAQGKVYKEIGVALGVSASTARTHLHNIYKKLAVANRAQAVLRATEMGWV